MNDLAVMYHYVRERGNWKGIFPLLPHEFEQQIEILTKKYKIVSVEDLTKPSNQPRCVLTFDDSTKDQYEVAFNILNKKGIPGYFAFMSGPALVGNIPVFHLVHTVLSFYSDQIVWEKLSANYDTSEVPERSKVYTYETDAYRRYNKYVLNFMLSEDETRKFLEEMFREIYPETMKFINDFYINKDELSIMEHSGMTIGVHCNMHHSYHGDAKRFYKEEIAPCKEYLVKEVGIVPKWYTPTYGGGAGLEGMMRDLTPILLRNGFKGAFTTVHRVIDHSESFWFDRFDCSKLPPKKHNSIEEALIAEYNIQP